MRLYCEVARHQSFSKAAVALGLTQSAVSQRIGALEKELSIQLFDRSVRPLALTVEGEVFLKEARLLVDRYDKLLHKMTQMQQGLSGNVVIETIYSAGIDLLNRVKQAFEKANPQVSVEIAYKRPEEIHDSVKHGRCDLGIVSYPRHWRDVSVTELRDEPMAVICGPDHELATRKKVDASELGPWPLVAFEASLPVGRHVRRYLRQHGVTPRLVGEFDNIDTMRHALTEVADSYAILPVCHALKQIARGSLVAVEMPPPLVRPLGVIYDRHGIRGVRNARGNFRGREFKPAVGAFMEFLLQQVGQTDEGSKASPLQSSQLEGVGTV